MSGSGPGVPDPPGSPVGPGDSGVAAGAGSSAAPVLIRDARPDDVPALLEMFAELADYEHLTHELRATERQLHAALFGARPVVEGLIAEQQGSGVAIGYAMFFPTFSTFLASTGVWLEDLFVRPAHRRVGRRPRAAGRGRRADARAGRGASRMGRAGLERACAELLPGSRGANHGGVDHSSADRGGSGAAGRGASGGVAGRLRRRAGRKARVQVAGACSLGSGFVEVAPS